MDILAARRYAQRMPRKESLSDYRRDGETLSQALERLRRVVKDADRDALVAELRTTAIGRSILAKAISAFGGRTAAISWMTNSAVALNGNVAANLCSTEKGRQRVLEYLERLDHGVYS